MSNYIKRVTDSLENRISELADNPMLFLRNPSTDFSRNRKINFKTFIGITMNSGGCTMGKELLDYFDFDTNTPTVSAYTQQRSKVLPEAFEYCELITTHVINKSPMKEKTKQVNFTIAIYICREFLRQKRQLSPPAVIKLIEKNILPVRPNRKDPRKVKPQAAVSFLYRVA